MATSNATLFKTTWARFRQSVLSLVRSEVGGKVLWLAAALVSLFFVINALNVVNSYVGRNFMTAIAEGRMDDFMYQAMLYVGVFALSTIAAVMARYAEESLGLLWRECLTRQMVTFYLQERIYYRLSVSDGTPNPDQRIAEDVRSYTSTTLSFALLLLNAGFTVVAFSGVLWSISPKLFFIAVAYAIVGSVLTVGVGNRLVTLNYDLLDKEADFRSSLIHVRENAESLALLHREDRIRSYLLRQFDALVETMRRIIRINRNVGFFTTGYNYLIQIIPALVVAPLVIRGHADFGIITQSAMAFTTLVGAFSLIITQFQSISTYAAVGTRLSSLADAIERMAPDMLKPLIGTACGICLPQDHHHHELRPEPLGVRTEESADELAFTDVSLTPSGTVNPLVKHLNLKMPLSGRLFVASSNPAAKTALFRAMAGLQSMGSGVIHRPHLRAMLFLAERPYLPPGALRDILVRPGQDGSVPDDDILHMLRVVGVEHVVESAGGLDQEQNWGDLLTMADQQLLAIARMLLAGPRIVVLERPETALAPEQVAAMLRVMAGKGIGYVTLGNADMPKDDYELLLDIALDGGTTVSPVSGTAGRKA